MNSKARRTHLKNWNGEMQEIPRPEEVTKPAPKKDRNRWCRGKVGVEHTPHWVRTDNRNLEHRFDEVSGNYIVTHSWGFTYVHRCTTCNRIMEWFGCNGRTALWEGGKRGVEFLCRCGNHYSKEFMDALQAEAKREHYARGRA